MSAFNLNNFWRFCSALKIDTKELGLITLAPERMMGTQKFFIEEVARGLNDDVHTFVCLKGRQVMITTICLALDLYWMFGHSGVSGSLVTHDEESREMFRSTLTMYIEGLPNEFKIPIESHNRTQLVARNRSRFAYQVAGTRKNTGLGKGKALTFLHSTETSAYGDTEGLASLNASLAQKNPDRLFIYESTAQGYNHFHDLCQDAKKSSQQRFIFVGWWRNHFYSVARDSRIFEVYGDTRLNPTERKWVREVKLMYGYDITAEQMAWWRWQMNEEIKDETLMLQNYPPHEDLAFILSGSLFFGATRINDEYKKARTLKYQNWRFVLRENFMDCELEECTERFSNIKIWEAPRADGHYVIGADPAYGSSEWADRFCVSVWRCYSDGMDQVAEFCTPDCTTYQFAWVMIYLAGAYKNTKINLEINGPGQAVWQEVLNLRRNASALRSTQNENLLRVLMHIENYLYKRIDSFGAPSAYHWKTTTETKERMLNFYKDCFERGMSVVRSVPLLEEMKAVVREDGTIGAPGRGKDDRVIAAALAHIPWGQSEQMKMIQLGQTRARSQTNGQATAGTAATNVSTYLKNLGIKV